MDLPRVAGDSSIAFLREGYRFGMHRFDGLGTDGFQTRLLLRPVAFLRGSDASRFFYEGDRFTRDGALPTSVLHSLQDEGSVQTLDGPAHHHRKSIFLDLMTPESIQVLRTAFRKAWLKESRAWAFRESIVLHDEAARVLTMAACEWAGVPLVEDQVGQRSREFLAMIDNAGSFGVPNWYGRTMRQRTEAWAREVVANAFEGSVPTKPGSALAILAAHRDSQGKQLPVGVAAIELLNVLRPTVAVGRFVVFAAWMLRRHPEWSVALESTDEGLYDFVQEVRRFSPFFPVVGGRAKGELEWNGQLFREGDWVLLDLFATNRDPRLWEAPEEFLPERFTNSWPDHNALIPQGGGDSRWGHRCPGEDPTIETIAEAVRLLTRETTYRVPGQDLRVSLRKMPALPESGFVMADVRTRGVAPT
jgi:fatty-acid peroxygenase